MQRLFLSEPAQTPEPFHCAQLSTRGFPPEPSWLPLEIGSHHSQNVSPLQRHRPTFPCNRRVTHSGCHTPWTEIRSRPDNFPPSGNRAQPAGIRLSCLAGSQQQYSGCPQMGRFRENPLRVRDGLHSIPCQHLCPLFPQASRGSKLLSPRGSLAQGSREAALNRALIPTICGGSPYVVGEGRELRDRLLRWGSQLGGTFDPELLQTIAKGVGV